MTDREPLISICIPVFNRPGLLRQAVESVQAQTYRHLEILISDNASTDDTVCVARDLARSDTRIRVLTSETNVVGLNYLRVVGAARGEYVKFLNSDDLLFPTAVEGMLGSFAEGVDLVFCDATHIDVAGMPTDPLERTPFAGGGTRRFAGRRLGEQMLVAVANLIGAPSLVMVRRQALDRACPIGYAGRTWRFLPDLSTWLQVLEKGDAVYIDQPLAALRVHQGQAGSVPGNDLVRVFDTEGLTRTAFGRGLVGDAKQRWSVASVCLKAFTNRPYAAEGSPGGSDQIEGIRLAVERLLGPPGEPELATGVSAALAVFRTDAELEQILHSWWQAFPARHDLVLLVPASDPHHQQTCEAVVAEIRRVRGWAATAVVVLGGADERHLDRPVVLVGPSASVDEIQTAMPPQRTGAPPWAPMLPPPYVQSEAR